MNSLLRDLYGHQSWADAEHWRAIEAHPQARDDFAIRKRLHHLHDIDHVLSRVTDARLSESVTMPWFKNPPLTLTVSELAQCAMHSQWHRGQNAVRLRELGATPPTVDLIVWYWKDRPAPTWD